MSAQHGMLLQGGCNEFHQEIRVTGMILLPDALNWLRRLTRLEASTVVVRVTGAVERMLTVMRSAMVLRSGVIAVCVGAASAAARTSRSRIRPVRPPPGTCFQSTPNSRATRRALG